MRREEGGASTYVAAAVGLALLLLVLTGGAALAELYRIDRAVDRAAWSGAMLAEIDGGLSERTRQAIEAALRSEGLDPVQAEIRGTPPGVDWGGVVELELIYPVALRLPAPGLLSRGRGLVGWRVDVRTVVRGTSNRVPAAGGS